jgi:exportin-1
LLSEEVFDFSKNTIVAQQASQLKQTMVNDFGAIFELCTWVLDQAISNPNVIKQSLIRQCLKTLQAFLSWIPLGYIFETNLVELILNNFVVPATTRIEGIKCFTEIATLPIEELSPMEQRATKEKICLYFCIFIQKITEITKNRSLVDEYSSIAGGKQ